MKDKILSNGVILILGHFRAKQSTDKIYDNMDEDLYNSVLFATQNKAIIEAEFKKIVKQEKEKSWIANFPTNLPEYITQEESENEFYCFNKKTGELIHLQIVYSLLTK